MKLMKWRNFYFGISLAIIIPGILSLMLFGLKPAIDFTGGSLWEIVLEKHPEASDVEALVTKEYQVNSVTKSGEANYIIRGKTITNDQKNQAAFRLSEVHGKLTEVRFETVGPILGKELIKKTIYAAVIVSLIITWFVGRQFHDIKFGVSAILAMLHDTLVLLGAFSILGKFMSIEVDVLFVTAMLTTLSFSVHDTIVVFDRIRELHRKHPKYGIEDLANAAVLETLSRSINNSMTIIFMLVALALMGGDSIRIFAIALLIGSVTGSYSSTFTAVPLLIVWDELKAKYAKKVT